MIGCRACRLAVALTFFVMLKRIDALIAVLGAIVAELARIAGLIPEYLRQRNVAGTVGLMTPAGQASAEPETPPAPPEEENMVYADDELMTLKEAHLYLGIARSTLRVKRELGELRTYQKPDSERLQKPRVWLVRAEVEAYYQTYTIRKGKDKKVT